MAQPTPEPFTFDTGVSLEREETLSARLMAYNQQQALLWDQTGHLL